jgi:hypothetical protein
MLVHFFRCIGGFADRVSDPLAFLSERSASTMPAGTADAEVAIILERIAEIEAHACWRRILPKNPQCRHVDDWRYISRASSGCRPYDDFVSAV